MDIYQTRSALRKNRLRHLIKKHYGESYRKPIYRAFREIGYSKSTARNQALKAWSIVEKISTSSSTDLRFIRLETHLIAVEIGLQSSS